MITGGIKFFTKSKVLAEDGGTIVASSGDVASELAIDKNPASVWQSVGSNDVTVETLTLTFASVQISRLFLQRHNFKSFNVQYWNGSAWTHFSSVVGLDGSQANVTETTFSKDTAYYEFAAVTTTQIRIQITSTQTTNAQKFISQIIACEEIGTLNGYPKIKNVKHSRNESEKVMLSGKVLIQKGLDSFSCRLEFDDYPTSYAGDLDIAMALFDLEEPFLVWLCGGAYGSTKFRYTNRGFRLQDIYLVQTRGDISPEYRGNIYINPVSITIDLKEHV